jgi:ribosome assembly protein 4
VDFVLRTGCFSEDAVRKNILFESDEQMAVVAKEKYHKALAGKGERLVSGSDDCTLYLWEPPRNKPIARMTGH